MKQKKMKTGTIIVLVLGTLMAFILLIARKEAKNLETSKKDLREEKRRKKKYGF